MKKLEKEKKICHFFSSSQNFSETGLILCTHVVKKNQKSREKSHSTNRPIAADIAAADARSRIFSDYSKTVSSIR